MGLLVGTLTPSVLLVIVHGWCQAENITYQWANQASGQPELGLDRQSYKCPGTQHLYVWQWLREAKERLSPALLNSRPRDHSREAEYIRTTRMKMGLMLFKPLGLTVRKY